MNLKLSDIKKLRSAKVVVFSQLKITNVRIFCINLKKSHLIRTIQTSNNIFTFLY